MVQCPKCYEQVLFDPESIDGDDIDETQMIYLDAQCSECKRKYSMSFSLERTYEKEVEA